MSGGTVEELRKKTCGACEGGASAYERADAEQVLEKLPGWQLTEDGKRIRRQWAAKDFMSAIQFFNLLAELAEGEGHHPDIHLVGYRNVTVELWTHSIDGLSENDFIMAAKIDELPIELKS